jgi:1,2-phenylacetyl-CoA epoxidase catalytic subunit
LPGSLIKAARSMKKEEVAALRSTADWVAVLKNSPAKAQARRQRLIAWLLIAAAIGVLLAAIAILGLRAR